MTKDEAKLFLDTYKENQEFIDKVSIVVATGVIPISIGFMDKIMQMSWLFIIGFIFVNALSVSLLILQIIGAIKGKELCNMVLTQKKSKETIKKIQNLDNKQKTCNNWINGIFIGILGIYLLIIGSFIITNKTEGTEMSDKNSTKIECKILNNSRDIPANAIVNAIKQNPTQVQKPAESKGNIK